MKDRQLAFFSTTHVQHARLSSLNPVSKTHQQLGGGVAGLGARICGVVVNHQRSALPQSSALQLHAPSPAPSSTPQLLVGLSRSALWQSCGEIVRVTRSYDHRGMTREGGPFEWPRGISPHDPSALDEQQVKGLAERPCTERRRCSVPVPANPAAYIVSRFPA
ncbi:hypothetical protein HFP69_01595 [Streptomyces sp. ARC12]|uniref:hypothetical protein n=1 Tax=Streptomyces TaxID=1883 RepID=UPI00385771EE